MNKVEFIKLWKEYIIFCMSDEFKEEWKKKSQRLDNYNNFILSLNGITFELDVFFEWVKRKKKNE